MSLKSAVPRTPGKRCHPEFAHPVAYLPQGLAIANVSHIRFRCLSLGY